MAANEFTRDELIQALHRFWPKVQIGGADECWLWTRGKDRDGYGRIKIKGQQVYAHRMAFTVTRTEDLRPGEVVMHTCDTPACCNPRHLAAGTVRDNIADRVAKGRGAHGRRPNPTVSRARQKPSHKSPVGHENLAERVGFEPT